MDNNSVVINKPFEQVWSQSIPKIGKSFFVINNIDKSSGILNLSYNGDPEEYIDCGNIHSYVKNLRGERTYDFPAAQADARYEIWDRKAGQNLWAVHRQMSLEGRMNVIFEKVTDSTTKVTVNTRYIVKKTVAISDVGSNATATTDDTKAFNTGGEASFPSQQGTKCRANGKFERQILDLIED
jgi:hypothetical protein